MRRRRFLGLVAAGAAALAAPLGWLGVRIRPAPQIEARRTLRYPGPVSELDPADVRRPGPWAG